MNTDLSDFQDLYFKTAEEYVSILSKKIGTIKESHTQDILEEVHRAAHSLKSQSDVMGFKSIAELSGELERTLKSVMDNKLGLSDDLINALNKAIASLKNSLEALQETQNETELSEEIEHLKEFT